ncbi:MAG TPA: Ig-like domain-containing protein, partial [Acidimicrobiales bacterium]
QAVTLAATVSGSFGTPTGNVVFENSGGTTLCTATLSGGHGSCTHAFTQGGAQTVKANYGGDGTYANSTGSDSFGSATIDVAEPATTTSIAAQETALPSGSLPSGIAAFAMNFTATVTASGSTGTNLAGSVTFSLNGRALSPAGCANQAVSGASPQSVTCTDTNPEDFGGPVLATYSGDPHFAGSVSPPVSPSFTPDPTSVSSPTSSPASTIVGQGVNLSAQVSAYVSPGQAPVGVVEFTSGGAPLCAAPVNSSFGATCATSALPTGTSSVVATYHDPAGGYASSTSGASPVTVGPSLYGVVGMAATPDGGGYWIVRSDGAVSALGDAVDYGSLVGVPLNKPIVGMAATPDGGGYWLVASDGGIFSFGSATFFGSTGGVSLNKPIVGMAATPDGGGYWLVASDGGIFAYGDAQFYGSSGSVRLNSPVVGMAAGPGGNGYWLVAADGGIFAYGSAQFFGSAGSLHLNKPVVGMAASPHADGYWLVASDGGIFTYGNTLFYGSTGGIQLNKPIVGMSSA